MCHVLKNTSFYHLIGPHFLCLLLSPPQGWELKHLLSVCLSVSEVKALLHLTFPMKTSQNQKTDEIWVLFLTFIFQYMHTYLNKTMKWTQTTGTKPVSSKVCINNRIVEQVNVFNYLEIIYTMEKRIWIYKF